MKETLKNTFSFGKKVVGTEHIQNQHDWIRAMAARTFSTKALFSKARVETFNQSVARQNIKESRLVENYKAFTNTFYVCLVVATLCAVLAIYYMATSRVIPGMGTAMIGCVLLSNAFTYSFRAFQIKHRNMVSVKEFLSRGKEIFPRY